MKGFANEGTSTRPHMAKAAYLRQGQDVTIEVCRSVDSMIEVMKAFANEGTSTRPHMAKAAYLRQGPGECLEEYLCL